MVTWLTVSSVLDYIIIKLAFWVKFWLWNWNFFTNFDTQLALRISHDCFYCNLPSQSFILDLFSLLDESLQNGGHLGFGQPSWIFRVVGKASSNGRISVGFYICTIGPQINNLKLKRLRYNFCPTSTIKIRSFTGLIVQKKARPYAHCELVPQGLLLLC